MRFIFLLKRREACWMKSSEVKRIITEISKKVHYSSDIDNIEEGIMIPLLYYRKKKEIGNLLKCVLYPIVKCSYSIVDSDNNSHILFIFGCDYIERVDQQKMFEKVVGLVPNTYVKAEHRIQITNILNLNRIVYWFVKLKTVGINVNQRLYIAILFYQMECSVKQIKRIISNHFFKIGIVWCDSHMNDYGVVQFLKKNGIKTATMQHGHYAFNGSFGDDNWDPSVVFNISSSDYFLCNNLYTVGVAEQFGECTDRFKVLGFPEFIGQNPVFHKREEIERVGVMLSYSEQETENKLMSDCIGFLYNSYGFVIEIRTHPGDSHEGLDNKYHFSECAKFSSINESIEDFIKRQDLIIVGSSTVYISCLFHGVPVIRCIGEGYDDYYEGLGDAPVRSIEQFKKVLHCLYYDMSSYMDKYSKYRSMLICEGNIADNYKMFLSEFV